VCVSVCQCGSECIGGKLNVRGGNHRYRIRWIGLLVRLDKCRLRKRRLSTRRTNGQCAKIGLTVSTDTYRKNTTTQHDTHMHAERDTKPNSAMTLPHELKTKVHSNGQKKKYANMRCKIKIRLTNSHRELDGSTNNDSIKLNSFRFNSKKVWVQLNKFTLMLWLSGSVNNEAPIVSVATNSKS
jgi:hypothetical protein